MYIRIPRSTDREMEVRVTATPEYERELELKRGMDRSR